MRFWSLARASHALYGSTDDCIFIQYSALFKHYFKFYSKRPRSEAFRVARASRRRFSSFEYKRLKNDYFYSYRSVDRLIPSIG
ncbi:hypothetical protein BURKHO8Y_170326 [Burkholderia sp. 8Y]|nr:hypothetical protein BURKHO8Y_170326 [Burkholderia sp. 8Y]